MNLFSSLPKWGTLRRIARDIKILHAELIGVRSALERIATAIEAANLAEGIGASQLVDPTQPAVEISHVDTQIAEAFMEIELQLTRATGMAPTEDEILAEFERRNPGATRAEGTA